MRKQTKNSLPLLAAWATKQVELYVDDKKRTKLKGVKQPFSTEKYKASLYTLASTKYSPLSDVAKKCGVDYKVLSVWRSQKDFKVQVERNAVEYAVFLRVAIYDKQFRGDDVKKIEEVSEEFCGYSLELQRIIVDVFLDNMIQEDDIDQKTFVLSNINVLLQRAIESLMTENPIKRSTLYEIVYLQNLQIFLMNKTRNRLYHDVIQKELIEKIIKKYIVKGLPELEQTLNILSFIDTEVDKILNWRLQIKE